MSTKLALVSINIVTFNAKPYMQTALASIKAQTYPHIEVNILDNNSQDDTLALIEKVRKRIHLQATTYKLQANLGFAKGHNMLIRKSRGEYTLLLNQDAWIDKEYIARALEIFAQDDTIAAIQPKIFRYNFERNHIVEKEGKAIIDATGLTMLKNRRVIARGQGEQDQGQFEKEEEVFGADGAVPIYRRSALEHIKIPRGRYFEYFDEDFFMYKEDVDLSWRLRLYGWTIMYSPKLLAFHARGSGESASTHYLDIIKERRNISQLAKSLSWRNQRLMQIKNELPWSFIRHSPRILFKEVASFFYILFFEHYTLRSIKGFFSLLPRALKKRRIIMEHRVITSGHITKWFQ